MCVALSHLIQIVFDLIYSLTVHFNRIAGELSPVHIEEITHSAMKFVFIWNSRHRRVQWRRLSCFGALSIALLSEIEKKRKFNL